MNVGRLVPGPATAEDAEPAADPVSTAAGEDVDWASAWQAINQPKAAIRNFLAEVNNRIVTSLKVSTLLFSRLGVSILNFEPAREAKRSGTEKIPNK